MTLWIEEIKTGEPLEFPVTRQLAAIHERRRAERDDYPERGPGWVFRPRPAGPNTSTSACST